MSRGHIIDYLCSGIAKISMSNIIFKPDIICGTSRCGIHGDILPSAGYWHIGSQCRRMVIILPYLGSLNDGRTSDCRICGRQLRNNAHRAFIGSSDRELNIDKPWGRIASSTIDCGNVIFKLIWTYIRPPSG